MDWRKGFIAQLLQNNVAMSVNRLTGCVVCQRYRHWLEAQLPGKPGGIGGFKSVNDKKPADHVKVAQLKQEAHAAGWGKGLLKIAFGLGGQVEKDSPLLGSKWRWGIKTSTFIGGEVFTTGHWR